MTLLEYINSMTRPQQAEFAARCGTTPGYMRLVAYGKGRRAGESLAISIDRESAGVVSMENLRPDIDWHHLKERLAQEVTGDAR